MACRFTTCPSTSPSSSARSSSAHSSAWICTSATLAVGDNFDHFIRRVGHARTPTTVRFGSPFDYEQQTLLYLPRGLDAPSSPRHTAQVVDAALPVLQASGGRAFLLFTSHRALREARRSCCVAWVRRRRFRCWCRATRRAKSLLKRFREYGNAVLLGTSSFWEGVDVKGAALSVVVIDKLPFAAPDDPGAEGAAGGDRAARRQSVLRRADSAGRHRAEAGRRPADARSRRLRRRSCCAISACARVPTDGSSSTACRRCRAPSSSTTSSSFLLHEARAIGLSHRRDTRGDGLRHEAARYRYGDRALLGRVACRTSASIERASDTQRGHADLVLPMVAGGARRRPASHFAQLDGIAYGRGPGAFTGVRIAIGVVQGLAFGADLPTVGISDLAAVAQQVARPGDRVLVCMDARMNEVYWGMFRLRSCRPDW